MMYKVTGVETHIYSTYAIICREGEESATPFDSRFGRIFPGAPLYLKFLSCPRVEYKDIMGKILDSINIIKHMYEYFSQKVKILCLIN